MQIVNDTLPEKPGNITVSIDVFDIYSWLICRIKPFDHDTGIRRHIYDTVARGACEVHKDEASAADRA